MLKIFFSLLICVLGHSSSLDNITPKKNLSEDSRVDPSVTNEISSVNFVKVLNKKTGIYIEDEPKNYYSFPEYNEAVISSKIQNSLLYILVPMYKSAGCIEDFASSLSQAIKELPEGCIVYSVFLVDDGDGLDRANDIYTLIKALRSEEILLHNYHISYHRKTQGISRTKNNLIDKMIEINDRKYRDENRNTYFLFMEPESMINKSAFKVFLSTAFLYEDKWALDFGYCLRRIDEVNKSSVILDESLSTRDFCYRYYGNEVMQADFYDSEYGNFDEYGFLKTDRFNAVWGYSPVLYKYDKTRIQDCKAVLSIRPNTLFKYLSSAYVCRRGLDEFNTIFDYECYLKYVFPTGYFAVFPKGFYELTSKRRSKRASLYYYRDYYRRLIAEDSAVKRRQSEDNSNFLNNNSVKRYRIN